ncbi:MAG: minor capsid protein [Oscillospiraceae bacterium]
MAADIEFSVTGRVEMQTYAKILAKRNLETGGKVQKYIDEKVLDKCERYVPFRSGTLLKSGRLSTAIGSGEVKYRTPYCRHVYYNNAGRGTEGTAHGGLRGRLWFERMKKAHAREILRGAAQISGGDTE